MPPQTAVRAAVPTIDTSAVPTVDAAAWKPACMRRDLVAQSLSLIHI